MRIPFLDRILGRTSTADEDSPFQGLGLSSPTPPEGEPSASPLLVDESAPLAGFPLEGRIAPAAGDGPPPSGAQETVPPAARVVEPPATRRPELEPVPEAERAPIPIAAVLAKRTQVHWEEAVAVISAVCTAALEADADRPRIPEPADIGITQAGEVLLRRGRADGEASHRLSRLLFELLEGERIPSQLRLFISTRIGGATHTVQQFARDLEFFARPGGPELIQALYARFHTERRKAATPTPPKPAAPPKPKPRVRAQRGRRLALAALLVLAAGGASAWVVWGLGSEQDEGGANLSEVTGRLGATLAEFRTAAADFGRSVGLPIPAAETGADDATPVTDALLPTPAAPAAAVPQPSTAVTPPATTESTSTATADPPSAIVGDPPVTVPASPAPVEPSGRAALEGPGPIYSAEDPGVEPPVMTYPQVRQPTPGASDVRSIELIVSATGEVEQAMMNPPARRLTDVMLVSNAKAWRFAPARLDGVPVRYRFTVDWAVGP